MEISTLLLNTIYDKETLYHITARQPKFILFLSDDQKVNPEEKEMLTKLLSALNIGINNLHIAPSEQIETIDSLNNMEFEFAIVSGSTNAMPERNNIFYTVNLQTLNKSIDEKKKLWAGLQKFKRPA